jgi:hypothetical protein
MKTDISFYATTTRVGINAFLNNFLEYFIDFNLYNKNSYLHIINPRTHFESVLNSIILGSSQDSRQLTQFYFKEYLEFDYNKQTVAIQKSKLLREINKNLSKHEPVSKIEKLKLYDHDNHKSWLRWGTLVPLFEKLTSENVKYFDQPINVVLPYHIYLSKLPPILQQHFVDICEVSGVWKGYPPKVVAKNLKLFTSFVKKVRDEVFGDGWYWLCDLETLFGYNVRTRLEDVNADLRAWIEDKHIVRGGISRDDYRKRIFELLVDDLSKTKVLIKSKDFDEKDLRSFLLNPNGWIVSGSSNGITTKLFDQVTGLEVKSAATKPAIFIEYGIKELYDLVLRDVKQEPFKPNVKIELGWKDRLIITCGNIDYIRMSYISYHIERLFTGDVFTTLFGGSANKTANYLKAMLNISNFVNMPMDSKNFDNYCGRDEILAFFDFIDWAIDHYFRNNKDLKTVMSLVRKSFDVHKWSIIVDDKLVDWTEGMPTGMRWTAFCGSFINYMRALFVREQITKKFGINVFHRIKVQGDDDDFALSSWFMSFVTTKIYESLSIPINLAKTFVSNSETEFLKKIVRKDRVLGYPARKVCSSLFISPEKKTKPDELYAVINFKIWDDCLKRGMDFIKYIDDQEMHKMLFVPKSAGGFGVYNDKRSWNDEFTIPVIVPNRFILLKSKKKTLLSDYININTKFVVDSKLNIDINRFKSSIMSRFSSSCTPKAYNNILRVERKKVRVRTTKLSAEDLNVLKNLVRMSLHTNWSDYMVDEKFVNLEWRAMIDASNSVAVKADLIYTLANAKSKDTINALTKSRNKWNSNSSIVSYYDGKYKIKIPYSKSLSEEYLSVIYNDFFTNLSINLLTLVDADTDHRFFRVERLADAFWRDAMEDADLIELKEGVSQFLFRSFLSKYNIQINFDVHTPPVEWC